MSPQEADYIIVGGGLTGCALATRLAAINPSSEVLLIEAGKDASANTKTVTPFDGFGLRGTELDWGYKSEPQPHTMNRVHENIAGKVLGGGSMLNYGCWVRGTSHDFDQWARAVGDERWSHQGFLPYFRRTEKFHDKNADPSVHGFDGPFHVTPVSASHEKRKYGLREPIRDAYTELGVPMSPDPSKSIVGICEHHESWYQGKRQPSNLTYGLDKVEVVTETIVRKVLLSEKEGSASVATGVELIDGRQITARKEVIISTGSFRSPQLLMLSGIGPASILQRHSIPVLIDAPNVGQGLFDHFSLFQFYKVRDPSGPYSIGNPHWTEPAYFAGMPADWAINETVPGSILRKAVEEDVAKTTDPLARQQLQDLLLPGRAHVEEMTLYAPILPGLPVDGSILASSIMLFIPTSRGSVSIRSANIEDPPVADPNFYATATDRVSLIYGTRRVLQALLGTDAGKKYIECDVPPPGMAPLTAESTDEEIDERIRAVGLNHMHAMGSNPMGKVVDTDLCVKGVRNLRVCDASVFPVAVSGHPQATLYALAEKAADIISGKA